MCLVSDMVEREPLLLAPQGLLTGKPTSLWVNGGLHSIAVVLDPRQAKFAFRGKYGDRSRQLPSCMSGESACLLLELQPSGIGTSRSLFRRIQMVKIWVYRT